MIRLGVIGARGHARRLRVAAEESGRARIAAVFHPTRKVEHPQATRRWGDLLDCDAVIVASPDATHFEYLSRLAGSYSGYVLCEKPPVATWEETERLPALDLDPARVMFDFQLRHSEFARWLRESLEDSSLGQPLHAQFTVTQGLAFKEGYDRSWRADGALHPHGVTQTKGIHYLDLLVHCFGEVETLDYRPANHSGRGTSPDTCRIGASFACGLRSDILVSWAAPACTELRVLGTNGILELREERLSLRSPRDSFDARGWYVAPPVVRQREFRDQDHNQDALEKTLARFLQTAAAKGEFPATDFARSLESNRLLLRMTASQA